MGKIQLNQATDWILLGAALIASMVVFSFLVRVLRATLSAVIALALLGLVLYFGFGLSISDLLQEMQQWIQRVAHHVTWP